MPSIAAMLTSIYHNGHVTVGTVVGYGFILLITWVFYVHFIEPFLSPLRKIPGKPYYPFIGNTIEAFREQTMDSTIKWMNKLKSPIIRSYFLMGHVRVNVASKEAVKYITVTRSKNFKRNIKVPVLVELFGADPLFFMSGHEHHTIRRLSNPSFAIALLKNMVVEFDKKTKSLIRCWKEELDKGGNSDEVTIDANSYFSKLTLDVFCKCGFDYEIQSLEGKNESTMSAIQRLIGDLAFSLKRLDPFYLVWPTKENRQRWADLKLFKNIIHSIITDKRQKIDNINDSVDLDILSQLLLARDEDGRSLSDDELYTHTSGFMFAGHETISSALSWTLLSLSEHPEIQQRAREEAQEILDDEYSCMTPETLDRLTYITCVVKESLRLHPPIPIILRQNINADTLHGYYIPPRTTVILHTGVMMRNPEYFPEPNRFIPERFSEQNVASIDRYTYQPFLGGPYNCIGNKFAMMELKTVIALLLREFQFSLPANYTYKRRIALTMSPNPPLRLNVKRIKSNSM